MTTTITKGPSYEADLQMYKKVQNLYDFLKVWAQSDKFIYRVMFFGKQFTNVSIHEVLKTAFGADIFFVI